MTLISGSRAILYLEIKDSILQNMVITSLGACVDKNMVLRSPVI